MIWKLRLENLKDPNLSHDKDNSDVLPKGDIIINKVDEKKF